MPVSPGTAVTATNANQAYPIFSGHKLVKTLKIQPLYSNAGVGFIGDSTLDPTTSPPTGVMEQLQTPSVNSIPKYELTEQDAPNGIDIGEFYVASTSGGDVFVWSINEQ